MSRSLTIFPELQKYLSQVETIKQDASELVDGLAMEQLYWRSDPCRWSIAECLEHLNMTARIYFPVFIQAINEARANGVLGEGPFRYGWFSNWFVRSAEPPPKLRLKTMKQFVPLHDLPMSEVWHGFLGFQDRLTELISRANGLDLVRVKIQLPTINLIKLSLGLGLGLITAHERRHIWQARQVRNDPDFPQ